MKKKTNCHIYILFFLLSFNKTIAQDYFLKITSKNVLEQSILKKVDYKKNHTDSLKLQLEIIKTANYLKKIGYFTNTIDSTIRNNNLHITFFSLNKKVEKAIITIKPSFAPYFKSHKKRDNKVSIPIEELESTLSKISENIDQQGKSFSKIKLQNIKINNNILFGHLDINESKKRTIQKTIVKNYNNFPKPFIKNYFNIKPNSLFNQKKIESISKLSKNLKFAAELKPPEVLFTKDSTFLYIYLEKKQNNSFDGIINFSSKDTGEIIFNGNINLKLENVFNTGEEFELLWNSIGDERQELKLTTSLPYIFNSKFNFDFIFSLYKQDSTYLNSKVNSKINYNINNKIKIGLNYTTETSENLILENLENNTPTYNSNFLGLNFSYASLQKDLFYNNKFYLNINPLIGKRNSNKKSDSQIKLQTNTIFIWDINNRSSIYAKNEVGILISDTHLQNELFRIGGAKSIRGYTEQSIFTKNYTFFNFEYRYLTSTTSYLYTITDIGKIKENNNNLLSFGLGYLFNTKFSKININTTLPKKSHQSFNFNDIQLMISWSNLF